MLALPLLSLIDSVYQGSDHGHVPIEESADPELKLLYPFYLDTDMSMAFAAALTGGVALEEEQFDRSGSTSQSVKSLRGNLKLWRAGGLDAGSERSASDEKTSESKLIRRHTVASIFIDLYDELRRKDQLKEEPDLGEVEVGDIVSVRMGPAVAPLRRIVDQVIRLIDLMLPALSMDNDDSSIPSGGTRQQRRATARERAKHGESEDDGVRALENVRKLIIALRDDLDQSGMVDIAVVSEHGTSAILMLDKRFLEPPTLELIHTSSFTVVGRVTSTWTDSDSFVNLYRRSVISLIPSLAQSMVWAIVAFLASLARGLDPSALEESAWRAIKGLPDDGDASLAVSDGEQDDPAASAPVAEEDDSNGAPEAAAEDDDVAIGDDISALTPIVQGPAVQILPLAICS